MFFEPNNKEVTSIKNGKTPSNIDIDFTQFEPSTSISPSEILQEVKATQKRFEALPHKAVLNALLKKVPPINFKAKVYPDYLSVFKEWEKVQKKLSTKDGTADEKAIQKANKLQKQLKEMKLSRKHYIVLAIEEIIALAQKFNWGLCKHQDFTYLFNGAYWDLLNEDELKRFIGKAGEQMGIDKYDARYFSYKDLLYKQFLGEAYLPEPQRSKNQILINLKNGTFEISKKGGRLRAFNRNDFLIYQLPFEYNPNAKAILFKQYLNTVQPDLERQNILAEYLAYVFTRHLKLEKTLLLYGTGANGKSVFFEIVSALFGKENVTNYTLQSLTNDSGYHRAKIANALVNYASEINGKLESNIFKQLVSGEPVEARLPYGNPMIIKDYARLIFNCNELPVEVEHNNAFFRRFLIVPFDVTIPEEQQDKELATKIIKKELSGVFNWVLDGLDRLLKNKKFSSSAIVEQQLKSFQLESDTVQLFLMEEDYQTSIKSSKPLKDVFREYREFAFDNGYKATSSRTFSKRLRNIGYLIERKNFGNAIFIEKK